MVGEGNGNPLQYSCLENPMGGGAWQAAVHGVTQSRTQLSNFTFTFHVHALEKEMATHSSVLAWRIPGTGSLMGCRLWNRTESDTTEATQQQQQQHCTNAVVVYEYLSTLLNCNTRSFEGKDHMLLIFVSLFQYFACSRHLIKRVLFENLKNVLAFPTKVW